MTNKRRIFVSSVQKELAAERRVLKDYIHGDPLLRRFFDVLLFENLPASGRRADEVYLKEVDRCDVYLGLLGNEYGYEDGGGLSPTEREFDRATAAGKERLIFVKGDTDSARHPKMQALVRKGGGQVVRRRFNSGPELTAMVYSSLVDYLAGTGVLRTRPFDAAACPDATISDLSRKKLSEFLARAQAERGLRPWPENSDGKGDGPLEPARRWPAEPCGDLAFRQTAPALSYHVRGQMPSLPWHGGRQADPVLSDLQGHGVRACGPGRGLRHVQDRRGGRHPCREQPGCP